MEATDLNLVTYVIKFATGRYYVSGVADAVNDMRLDWSRPYSTDNLVEANIYNDPAHAKRVCKQLAGGVGATVRPVSKKIFFEATLKGERQ